MNENGMNQNSQNQRATNNQNMIIVIENVQDQTQVMNRSQGTIHQPNLPLIEEERGEAAFNSDQGSAAVTADGINSYKTSSLSSNEEYDLVETQPLISKRSQNYKIVEIAPSHHSKSAGNQFYEGQSWELWIIFICKLLTSLIFLIDDLTFLVYCQYEFNMTQQEAGILFCVTAICLFTYGLTISGYLIDKLGVKYSLLIGLVSISIAKFLLTFIDTISQLYIVMCTISPFGISILFPCLVLGVKKLTFKGPFRNISFSVFYAFMVFGGLLGGPIVDFIRRDVGKTQFEYLHTNVVTGKVERRYIEVSAWRTISFFGFILYSFMILLMLTYNNKVEQQFQDGDIDQEALQRMTCFDLFYQVCQDYQFWRFMLFSFVIVGSKMVFALLFFMIPKMITQEDGQDAPFGLYISVAPMLIIVFLIFLAPLQAKYPAYDLILIGTSIATLGPIPMFFGMNLYNFMIFIVIVSFAEALYAPMINVFSFNFTKDGHEGTFLTLTAAPVYFTMALTGIVGGYLLENYYPAKEDATHHRKPNYIWFTIILFSAISVAILQFGKDYFNHNPENEKQNEFDNQYDNNQFQDKKQDLMIAINLESLENAASSKDETNRQTESVKRRSNRNE